MSSSHADDQRIRQLQSFVAQLPKIELHAHLNGCIRESTLFDLAKERNVELSKLHFDHESSPHASVDGRHMYNVKPRKLQDCFDMFAEIPKCVNDLESLQRITREALEDFADQRVVYLELRSTPKRLLRHDGSLATKHDYIQTILNTLQAFEQNRSNDEWSFTCRFIVAVDRSNSVQEAEEHVDLAIAFHRKEERRVVGVDLGGNPTKNDFRDYRPALQRARDAGLKVTIHCAEIPCGESVDEEDPSLRTAYEEARAILEFAPDRLGHALLLPKSLQSILLKSKIPVETCPTSNVMTLDLAKHVDGHLVEGHQRHPQLEVWLAEKHPLTVATDDPGVFNTNSTKELLVLAMAWDLTERQLEDLMFQSLDYVFCGDDLKKHLKEQWLNLVSSSRNESLCSQPPL